MPHSPSRTILELLRDLIVAQPGLSRGDVCTRAMQESSLSRRYLAKELDRLIRAGNVCLCREQGPESLSWVSNHPLPRSLHESQDRPARIFRAAGTWTGRDAPPRDPLTDALFRGVS